MIYKEKNSYKTISEVAELLNLTNSKTGNLSTHTLRFWEKDFQMESLPFSLSPFFH